NRTVIPGLIVDAVVVQPKACHPSYAQGYYDRDNRFYLDWDAIARDAQSLDAWLKEWVFDLQTHADYVQKLGAERWDALVPGEAWSEPVNYGRYE
ncbi:MAG TPA: CoA transferase subunit A, partial [Actinomycetota bacterium]|nr:CoA transferase subunit A [Actinomycetota bacterium]